MVLCNIASLDEKDLRVLQVKPVICHGAATKRCRQTGNGGTVANSGLVFDVYRAEHTSGLRNEVALLVGVLRPTQKGDSVRAVNRNLHVANFLGGDPGLFARVLDLFCDPIQRVIPADLFPLVAAGSAVHRFLEPLRRVGNRRHRRTLAAQSALVDHVIRIAFQVHQFAVPHLADHAATTGAEVARGGELRRAGNFQIADSAMHLPEVDAQLR